MIIGKQVQQYQSLASTSDKAIEAGKQGAEEGLVIIAKEQTRGRGRQKKKFYSPPDQGIYLSVLLKPFKNPKDLSNFTIGIAKTIALWIRSTSGLKPKIKPPNDILVNNKKITGILVERIVSNVPQPFLVVGIGININTKEFPKELQNNSTSLFLETKKIYPIPKITKKLLLSLDRYYLDFLAG